MTFPLRSTTISRLSHGIIGACLLTLGTATHAALAPTERTALDELYTALNGDGWTNNSGWKTSDTPCLDWHGIVCDATGTHVIEIDFFNNNAVGSIPNSIQSFTQLRVLDLTLSKLGSSTIPAEMGALAELRELYITDASLVGNIPVELAQLAQLEILYLDDNFLSGQIPEGLGLLDKLRELRLYNNQLTGPIPNSFGSLRVLADLRLYNNALTGEIPASLTNLRSLEFLNLDWNALHSNDATLNTYIDQRLYNTASTSYLDTQTLDANPIQADVGETAVRLHWTAIDTTPQTSGGYNIYAASNADGPYGLVKSVALKSTSNALIEGLRAQTTYFFKVRSYSDDANVINLPTPLESSGDLYTGFAATTLTAGSGNNGIDSPTAPDNPDTTGGDEPGDSEPDTTPDSEDGDSGGGGGAPSPLVWTFMTALMILTRLRIKR